MKTFNVPFKTRDVLNYVNGERPDFIDLSNSPLAPHQLWNYLSFLKTTEPVLGLTPELLAAYMRTTDFVRVGAMSGYVKQVLHYAEHGMLYPNEQSAWSEEQVAEFVKQHQDLVEAHLMLLRSLPSLLWVAKGAGEPTVVVDALTDVGVNFANVFSDPLFLITLLPSSLAADPSTLPYYKTHFDAYIYGGDNLIWFVNSNPDNLLFAAML